MFSEKYKGRFILVALIIFILFALIFGRLIDLQIFNGDYYKEQSEKRLMKSVKIKAPRGEIMDRNGDLLIKNTTGFSVQMTKLDLSDQELNQIILNLIEVFDQNGEEYSDSLPITDAPYEFNFVTQDENEKNEQIQKFLKDNELPDHFTAEDVIKEYVKNYHIDENLEESKKRALSGVLYEMEQRLFSVNTPFVIATNVSIDTVTKIKERYFDFKGVNIVTEPVREYAKGGTFAAHILGRVGNIYKEEYEQLKDKGYDMNDILGKDGMEKYLEEYLRGEDGVTSVELNVNGKYISAVEERQPKSGNYAMLTLDSKLQQVAEESLARTIEGIQKAGQRSSGRAGADCESGAVVALDVNSGEVLAMASYPTYNLETFNEDYSENYQNPAKPMWNRAISGTYAPGSTFKMLTAIAALEEGIVTPQSTVLDEGIYKFYAPSYSPHCWIYDDTGRTHGSVDVVKAISQSCNYYFYDVGRRLGIDKLYEYGKKFGLGEYTGIELSGESKGILAGPVYREQIDAEWYPGDTLQASIGQSDHLFTPVQLANYVATLANGGNRYKVHLVKRICSYENNEIIYEAKPEVVEKINMSPENQEAVLKGMREVAISGTASAVFKDFHIPSAGKTGTASVSKGTANGVFVAYAPYENPQIAIAVIAEHGAHGNYAAPVARDIIDAYFGVETDENQTNEPNVIVSSSD